MGRGLNGKNTNVTKYCIGCCGLRGQNIFISKAEIESFDFNIQP